MKCLNAKGQRSREVIVSHALVRGKGGNGSVNGVVGGVTKRYYPVLSDHSRVVGVSGL